MTLLGVSINVYWCIIFPLPTGIFMGQRSKPRGQGSRLVWRVGDCIELTERFVSKSVLEGFSMEPAVNGFMEVTEMNQESK